MKLLLYGGNGWIGTQFKQSNPGHEIVDGKERCDNVEALRIEIGRIMPDRVISFIGRTSGPGFSTIDYLEQKGKLVENLRDNLFGPLTLTKICRDLQIHFTYLGTGCIFTGTSETEYLESDEPNFFGSQYSVVKGFTDRLMHQYPVLNLRIRMPVSAQSHPKNFLTKILTYPKIYSSENSLTILPDVIPVMYQMIEKQKIGTVNLVNPGFITHREILQMYKEIVDCRYTWQEMTEEEHNSILLAGRSKCVLHSTIPVPEVRESLKKIFQNWN